MGGAAATLTPAMLPLKRLMKPFRGVLRDSGWLVVPILAFLPSAYLICAALGNATGETWGEVFYRPFLGALARSGKQVLWVSALAFLLGWPFGTLCGLLRFPTKWLCLAILALPLVVPPFLWAIGIQGLKPFLSFGRQAWLDGFPGCVLAYTVQAMPIVALVSAAAASQISQSERESVLLFAGARRLLREALRCVVPVAAAGAVLGGVLTLSDSGCGQIMGYLGVSGDILIAFSARHDFAVASIKALVTGLLALPLVAVASVLLSRRLNFASLGKQLRPHQGLEIRSHWTRWGLAWGMPLCCLLLMLPAFVGLVRPLVSPPRATYLLEALRLLRESALPTLYYGVGAGVTAIALGLMAALAVGHAATRFRVVLAMGLSLLAVPPALHAMGMVSVVSRMPEALSRLFQNEISVGVMLGWRLAPVAVILICIAWRRLSPSVLESARLHGVRSMVFVGKVAIPSLWRPVAVAFLIIALLALADVSTTVLLQPPGAASFGTHLFAVMDNSSEKLVAALCLGLGIWPATVVLAVAAFAGLAGRRTTGT